MRLGRLLAWSVCLSIVVALAPSGAGVATEAGRCPEAPPAAARGHLTTKTYPATPALSTTAYGVLLAQGASEEDREAVNGLDAYIFDLGCQTTEAAYCIGHQETDLSDPDLYGTFRGPGFDPLGGTVELPEDPSCDGETRCSQVSHRLPGGTRYLEVTAESIGSGDSQVHTGSQPTWAAFTLVTCQV